MGREFVSNPSIPSGCLRFRSSRLTTDGPFTAFGAPDGAYSRVCWLPVLGPTAWVLWGKIARDLDDNAAAVYAIDEITGALGLGRRQRLMKALNRLDRFGIATTPANGLDDVWELPSTTPPLPLSLHSTVSATARRFHHRDIGGLDDPEQHDLYEIFPSIYIDHFGGHRY